MTQESLRASDPAGALWPERPRSPPIATRLNGLGARYDVACGARYRADRQDATAQRLGPGSRPESGHGEPPGRGSGSGDVGHGTVGQRHLGRRGAVRRLRGRSARDGACLRSQLPVPTQVRHRAARSAPSTRALPHACSSIAAPGPHCAAGVISITPMPIACFAKRYGGGCLWSPRT